LRREEYFSLASAREVSSVGQCLRREEYFSLASAKEVSSF
jgi:hypothetical protein